MDLEDKDPLLNEDVEDLIMLYTPWPAMTDHTPYFKMEFNATGLQLGAVPDHSVKKRPAFDDLEEKDPLSTEDHFNQDVENETLSQEPQSSGTALMPDFRIELDAALCHPEALFKQPIAIRHIVDGVEELKPLSNKKLESQDNNTLPFSRRLQSNSVGSNIDSIGTSGVEQREAPSDLFATDMPKIYGLENKKKLSNEDAVGEDTKDSLFSYRCPSSLTDHVSNIKTEFDVVLHHPGALSKSFVTSAPIVDGLENKDIFSNEAAVDQYAKNLSSYGCPSSFTDCKSNFKSLIDVAVRPTKTSFEPSAVTTPIVDDIEADKLTSIKIQNINVPSASVAMDIAEQSLDSNQLILSNQKPVDIFQQSELQNEKTPLLITNSTHADQEKLVLRRRKNNAVYYESSDSDEEDMCDEEQDTYRPEAYDAVSSEEFDTEILQRKGPSKDQICPDSRKNYSIDKRLKFRKWKFIDYSKEQSPVNTLFKKIPTKQSPENSYICRICNESFSLRLLLLNHMKAHDRIEIQQCQFYCSQLKNKYHLDCCFDTQNGTKDSFECDICKKTYPHRRSLSKHKQRHNKANQYLCYICGLSLCSTETLNRHMQIHTGEKCLLCDRCGMQFRHRDGLNYHMKVHLRKENKQIPEKLFECKICNKKLESRSGYATHVKKHIQKGTHECEICRRNFFTRIRLTEHMRTHTGEKPFECQTCGNTFAQFAGLYNHMKSHSNEKPHRCKFCDKEFKTKKSLSDHLNTHTGARPYKCKQCDKGFGSDKGLRTHKKIHKGKSFREKKYSCNICSEVFAVSAYRDLHVALHANPNPFSCEFCSKSFNYKKNMVAHVQRLHPDRNPFKCKLCGKTYDSIRKICVHISSRACYKKEKSPKKVKNQSKFIEGDGNINVEKIVNMFVCNICDDEFLSVEDILGHFNSSHKHSK
ncbi:zinc finger protein 426-like isoform X3 [Artemia franciscana]|uniref:zinc finger protein 426-like isoform X3 n=1 Tax=Artemia franciscana TaxID=6661 RepID=UPI0032DB033A